MNIWKHGDYISIYKDGMVKIFKYPCVDKGAKFVTCKLHADAATNVRFSADDTYLYTIGNDRVIGQWRVVAKK